MTRKRRKTRSRQERRRIHARTRQTFRQAMARYVEFTWRDPPSFVWPRAEHGPLATHNRFAEPFLQPFVVDECVDFTAEDWERANRVMRDVKVGAK